MRFGTGRLGQTPDVGTPRTKEPAMISGGLRKNALPADCQPYFQDKTWRVVVIPRGTRLWKLSQYSIPKVGDLDWQGNKATVSQWWANVYSFQEDTMGIHARIEEAKLNLVSFQDYIRFTAAVRIDWNLLTKYQEITLADDCMAFWGALPRPLR
jgi:hypothetical protein